MLKGLAILTVFSVVAQIPVPATGQMLDAATAQTDFHHNKTQAGHSQANANSPAIPIPPESAQPKAKPREDSAANAQDSVAIINSAAANKRDAFDYITLAVEIILAVITGGGVIAAWRGLPEFKRQAEAAKDAAEAAKLNAQAVMNAERAWIVIEVERESSVSSH